MKIAPIFILPNYKIRDSRTSCPFTTGRDEFIRTQKPLNPSFKAKNTRKPENLAVNYLKERDIEDSEADKILEECSKKDGRLNLKVFEKLQEFIENPKLKEKPEVFNLIAGCINDRKNGKVNEKALRMIKEIAANETPHILLEILSSSYDNDDKIFYEEDMNNFYEVLSKAKLHKQELRSAADDLNNEILAENFIEKYCEITDAAQLIGINGIVSAFSLKIDNFLQAMDCVEEAYTTLALQSNKELLQKFLKIANPTESNEYKTLQKKINKLKQKIANSKTDEQKSAEEKKKLTINRLKNEISSLKIQLSSSETTDMQKNAIKKEIKAKLDEIGAIKTELLPFANEKTPQDIKNTIKEINSLQNKQKILRENALKDPQDIIEKLMIFSALRFKGIDYSEFIEKMNTKTPEEKAEFKDYVSQKLYDFLGCKYDKKAVERLGLEKSKYFANIFMENIDSLDFREYFGILYDLIRENPQKTNKDIFNSLEQNILTKEIFEEHGINYDRWVEADKNSFVRVKVQKNAEKARKSAVLNLEKDLNDPIFAQIPQKEAEKFFNALKNAGIELIEKTQLAYDEDGFITGQNKGKHLYYAGQPMDFEHLKTAIHAIKEFFNKEDFWNIENNDPKVENARQTILNHLLNLRKNDYKNALRLKQDETAEIEVQKTDMNDISHSLFLGNDASCCTAIGTGINSWSAPAYITNKCISSIEIKDGSKFVGNTMCYIAKVDEKPALVLDNIELETQYQYNDKIKDAIIEYAKKLTREIGQPQMPIYAGPYRHKVDFSEYPYAEHYVNILGKTFDEVYIDYLASGKVIDNTADRTKLYKIR